MESQFFVAIGLFLIFMYVTAMINYGQDNNKGLSDENSTLLGWFLYLGIASSIAGCVCCCCLACPCCKPEQTLSTFSD